MAISVSRLVAAATVLVPAVRASTYSDPLDIASNVDAGEATPVDINFDSDNDYDEDYQGFRLYLATTPPGWGTGPACYLVNYTSLDTSSVDITIPAAVAPDGTELSLAYSLIDTDDYWGQTYTYSNDFTLSGGTGEWSALELNGYSISSPDYCPCTALQCSRECSDKYFPDGNLGDEDDDEFEANYTEWFDCLSACPGTSYPISDYYGDDGDDDSSTSTGLQTSTQTASANGASETAASASATSSSSSSESTGSATSSTSATQTTTTTTATAASGAGRTALTTTALLVWCFGMALWL